MTRAQAAKIAHKYAPIFAHKVSDEWIVADRIAPIDFAGEYALVAENPTKLDEFGDDDEIPAKVYYSVCETSTHYFLTYLVYHVLDWWKRGDPTNLYDLFRDAVDEHVHDMEGALLVVTKEPAELVDAVVTVAHNNFYLYTEPRRPTDVGEWQPAYASSLQIAKFNETVDGNIWLDSATDRVKLYIEARGHGMYGSHKRWGSGDQIWYYSPKDGAQAGTFDVSEKLRAVEYELVDIFAPDGLWAHRFNDRVFRQRDDGKWGVVYKEKNGERKGGAANPPWSWNDHNDKSPLGEIATDPARFIIRYGQGWGPVSTAYSANPYQGIS